MYTLGLAPVVFAALSTAFAQDPVFRSDVSLVRVDAQVMGRDNRAIAGLRLEDFELREEGRPQQIRNFASEEMPVDVLLLLDVSGSMRPHIQRMADAAHEALRVLGPDDRVGMMVFDRSTRVRLTFRSGRNEVEGEFTRLLNQETFNGGTDITRGLLDAAEYVRRNARAEARRAIVILTDDRTERSRDEASVQRALLRADAVLSALIAPDAMRYSRQMPGQYPGGGSPGSTYPGSTYPGNTWPRSGGGNGPLGGVILGQPRYPGGGYPGGGYPGGRGGGQPGGQIGGGTHSAGTSEIARASGGDSMPVDYAGAFEDTLARLRQRYALHFNLPPGIRAGQERSLDLSLSAAARRRYPNAEVRYRKTYVAARDSAPADPNVVTQGPAPPAAGASAASTSSDPEAPRIRRRPAVDPVPAERSSPSVAASPSSPAATPADSQSTSPPRGGWRRLKPGEEP